MSHPDDTGSSAFGKAFSAIRRLRRPATEPSPAPASVPVPDDVQADVPAAPRAESEDAAAIEPSPIDIPEAPRAETEDAAEVETTPVEATDEVAPKESDEIEPEETEDVADEPVEPESTETESEAVAEPADEDSTEDAHVEDVPVETVADGDAGDGDVTGEDEIDGDIAEPTDAEPAIEAHDPVATDSETDSEIDSDATVSAASAPAVETPVVERSVDDEEPDTEDADSAVIGSPTPSLTKTAAPSAAPTTPDDAAWRSDTAAPQYIPPSTTPASADKQGRSRRVVLWLASIVVIVVAITAVVVALFATRSDPAKPAADQAAEAATKYTTALGTGDLTTLRAVTCGERKQFYDQVAPDAFRQQFETQKANNELVGVRGVKAARVVDPSNAIVEVTAFTMSTPEKTTDVALRLRKDDGTWKVCMAG